MPPEANVAEAVVGHPADIFAAGVLLCELWCGCVWQDDKASPANNAATPTDPEPQGPGKGDREGDREWRGECMLCREGVFSDQEREADGPGAYRHAACAARQGLTVAQLKALLAARGLKRGGCKAELLARLRSADGDDIDAEAHCARGKENGGAENKAVAKKQAKKEKQKGGAKKGKAAEEAPVEDPAPAPADASAAMVADALRKIEALEPKAAALLRR